MAKTETENSEDITNVIANLAMRHNATLDWDDKAFTVKPPVSW